MYFIDNIPAMFLVLFSPLLLSTGVQGHMIMANPVPYGAYASPKIDNSPLDSSGSNYPCKVTSDPASWYSTAGIDNTYAAGSTQTLSFNGSAVHGGGSCQLAVTSDMQPDAQTSWRVILSIESGCPTTDGTTAATYNWTVPADLDPGQYSFAWTWISKEAGQPEFYMNCAPITVTAAAGSKKRADPQSRRRAAAAASDYPELFVANLDSVNSCKVGPGVDPVYPDPGPSVEKLLTVGSASFASATGTGCVPLSQTQNNAALPTPTAGGSAASAATTTAAAAGGSATGAGTAASSTTNAVSGGGFATATATTTTGSPATATAAASSSDTLSVYVSPVTPGAQSKTTSSASESSTSASASSSAEATTSSSSSAAKTTTTSSSSAKKTTTVAATTTTSTVSSSSSSSSSAAAATTTGSGSGSSNSTSSSGSGASTKSGTCTDEGMFNCVGSEYQQCASGAWTAMQALPAGTTCKQGESETLWARDARINLLRKARRGAGTKVWGV